MKKILFYESRPEWGGAQKCEYELIRKLEDRGYEIYVVCSVEGPLTQRLDAIGKAVTFIPVPRFINDIRQPSQPSLWRKSVLLVGLIPHFVQVAKFILKHRIHLVYTSQFRSQLMMGWLAWLMWRKVIWHIHGEEKLHTWLGRVALTFADKIIVVSETLNQHYRTLFPRHQQKFHTVYNGLDLDYVVPKLGSEAKQDHMHDQDHECTRIRIVHLAAIIPLKRQDMVLTACHELKRRGHPLQVDFIGEKPHWHNDEYMNQLQAMVKLYELEQNVTWLGWVDRPVQHLSSYDLMVLPSDSEGLPLSIIEAMSQQLPCIATNVGGVAELIKHGETGWIISKGSCDELVQSITSFIRRPELRSEFGRKARLRYETYFRGIHLIEGVAKVIASI